LSDPGRLTELFTGGLTGDLFGDLLGDPTGVRAVALAVFVVCLTGTLYIYFGYPTLLWVLSRLRPRPLRLEPRPAMPPRITVIIPAYNEEEVLTAKLDNTVSPVQEVPGDRLEVLVVSDGSTDRTEELARSYAGRRDLAARVRLLALPRGGKARALDAAAAEATGDVLVLTDANALLAPGALAALVEPFADPEVGGVCGRKRFRRGLFAGADARGLEVIDATAEGEGLYQRWDQWQKSLESRIGSVFAADGALYAVRRDLYVPIADPAQADDIAVSTRVVLQGFRLVEAPGARVLEEPPEEGREEFRRKVRVTNHSVRALLLLGSALWTRGFYSLELLSHKLLRHLVPFLLLPLLLATAVLAPGAAGFGVLLGLQLAFYGLALAGFLLRHAAVGRTPVLSTPYYFSMVNAAALLGVVSLLRGERRERWTPRRGLDP
jgi:cellulose synthase/poly-beta-1,6-N-acetylglucosamine synthase-like glycosyltransferase